MSRVAGGRPVAICALMSIAGAAVADVDIWWDLSAGADVTGYPQVTGLPAESQLPAWGLDQTLTGRFNLVWYPSRSLELGFHYGLEERARLAQGEGDDSLQDELAPDPSDFRWRDPDALLVDKEPVRLSQNLDRAYVRAYPGWGDLTLGRQPISFGLARVYSPVEVILPTGLQAQEPSYRPGVDAWRWLLPLGAVSELDVGWVFGDDQVLFARGYSQFNSLTWEATALSVNQTHHVLGLGTQTSIGDWGVWQEVAVLMTAGDDEGGDGIRLTLGLDQQFFSDVYGVAEYHFNSPGLAGDYTGIGTSGWHQTGLVSPWGKHYVSLQLSRPVSALWQLSAGQSVNLSDGGILLTGALSRSLGDNSTLDFTALHAIATQPRVTDNAVQVVDEYGVYPSRIQVNWRAVF